MRPQHYCAWSIMRIICVFLLLIALSFTFIAYSQDNSKIHNMDSAVDIDIPFDVLSIKLGNAVFDLKIAATPESISTGLSKFTELGENQGMIFIFPNKDVQRFWMKNISIPLTLAFVNDVGIILELHDMTPESTNEVSSKFPVQYAIELKKGAFERCGVTVGS